MAAAAADQAAEYSLKDVASHKSANDAWMVIHGQVYDVTKYIHDHPGGAEVLVEAAGADASEAFDSAGHSEDAFEIMAEYRVGKAKGGSTKKPAAKVVRIASVPPPAPSGASSAATSPKKIAAAASVVTLGAVALYGATGVVSRLDDRHFVSQLIRQLTRYLPHLKLTSTERRGGLGFIQGFALAAGLVAVAGTVAMRRFSKLLSFGNGLTQFPPHMKASTLPKPDPLLQRGWLDPVHWQSLPLEKKELLAPGVYRLTFILPTPTTVLGLPTGQHVSIRAEIDGKNVSRSYTPVSNNSDLGVLVLVIRCYPDGLLTGRYLANLEVGDEVQFRGPKGAMRYHRNSCKRIGMLAGGTGITPMFQLIRAICEDRWDTTEVSLVYACRNEGDILLRKELEAFARKYPQNLKVHYLLDEAPADWKYGVGHVTAEIIAERFPTPAPGAKIMICGPPGMVGAAKKMLAGLGFEQPGAISKMDDQVFCF